MKILHSLKAWGWMASLLLAACAGDELEDLKGTDDAEADGVLMVAEDFDGDTRAQFADGGKFSWTAGDEVGVMPHSETDPVTGSQICFTLKTPRPGKNTAVFTGGGWSFTPNYTYVAYYPYINKGKMNLTEIPVDYTKQVYSYAADRIGATNACFMTSAAVTPKEGKAYLQFLQVGGLAELNVPLPEAGTLKSITLSTPDKDLIATGSVDLSKASATQRCEVEHAVKVNAITVGVDGMPATTAADEMVKVYFMMAPVDLTGKALSVTYTYVPTGAAEVVTMEDARVDLIKENGFVAARRTVLQAARYEVVEVQAEDQHLPELITEEKKHDYPQIKVQNKKGWLNGTDIKFLREMATPSSAAMTRGGAAVRQGENESYLKVLDLTEARIGPGGVLYDGVHATAFDEISAGFFANTRLEKFILPRSIITIADDALAGSAYLTDCMVPKGSELASIGKRAFKDCKSLKSLKNINFCTSLKSLPEGIFSGCSALRGLDLSGIEEIGPEAFKGCTALMDLIFPKERVLNIGVSAFEDTGLTFFDFSKADRIADRAFAGTKFSVLTLYDDAVKLGSALFDGCVDLTKLTIWGTKTDWNRKTDEAGNFSGPLEGMTHPEIDLVLPLARMHEVTNGNCWAGYTWKSILLRDEGDINDPDGYKPGI